MTNVGKKNQATNQRGRGASDNATHVSKGHTGSDLILVFALC